MSREYDMVTRSGLNVTIAKKISDIPAQDWDKVYPETGEGYNFFKTLDESGMSQFLFYYILVYDKGVPVGAASCFIMDFALDFAVTGVFKKVTTLVRHILPFIFNPRILLCGLPNGQGRMGISGDPGPVIKAISEALEWIAQERKAQAIVFKDFDFRYKPLLNKSLDPGFFRIRSLPYTEMKIRFASFDEYLKKLSYSSRSGLRRKYRKIDEELKFRLEVTNRLEKDVLNEAYRLYLQTFGKKELGLDRVPEDFFWNISNNMPDKTKFFLWRADNRLVAFSYCLVSGGCFIDYYLGFDYSVAYQYNLYFVRFRDQLNWCIENKVGKYEFGPTGYESKRRLGFRLVPLYNYVRYRNRVLNPVFKVFSQLVVRGLYKFFLRRQK